MCMTGSMSFNQKPAKQIVIESLKSAIDGHDCSKDLFEKQVDEYHNGLDSCQSLECSASNRN